MATEDSVGCSLGAGSSGSEVVYSFVAGQTGNVRVTVTRGWGFQNDPVVYVREACGDDAELICDDEVEVPEAIEFAVTAGEDYFVFVDAFLPHKTGPYTIEFAQL